jgi:hypothetical protein
MMTMMNITEDIVSSLTIVIIIIITTLNHYYYTHYHPRHNNYQYQHHFLHINSLSKCILLCITLIAMSYMFITPICAYYHQPPQGHQQQQTARSAKATVSSQ